MSFWTKLAQPFRPISLHGSADERKPPPMPMQPSRFYTIPLPMGGPLAQPTAVAIAASHSVRVLVKNTGVVLAFLGQASGDVTGPSGPTPETYRLPPGDTDVFVLAPQQKLYAVGGAGPGLLSVAISEAFQIDIP